MRRENSPPPNFGKSRLGVRGAGGQERGKKKGRKISKKGKGRKKEENEREREEKKYINGRLRVFLNDSFLLGVRAR